jgi:predicted phage gp36 major capsid-like protein
MDETTYRAERGRLLDILDDLQARVGDELTPDEAWTLVRTTSELSTLTEQWTADRAGRRADLAEAVRAGTIRTEPGAGRDDDPQRSGPRGAAMRCLAGLVSADAMPARSAATVEKLMSSGSMRSQSWVAQYVEASGSPHYLRAFSKLAADPQRGHLVWTPEEADAYRRVAQLTAEERAGMTTTDSASGFLTVPLQLDPTIMLSSAGSTNPLRQIGRVVTIAGTDTWQGVSSAGTTAEWLAEATEAVDATPTLAGPSITAFKAACFVPYSFELAYDAMNFESQLGKLLMDGYQQLTNTAYTTGTAPRSPSASSPRSSPQAPLWSSTPAPRRPSKTPVRSHQRLQILNLDCK